MDNKMDHLLRSNLKRLRLPTILTEHVSLAKEASNENVSYTQYLLKLTELEVTTRLSNALARRIKQAGFPVEKDLSDYDFSALPSVNFRTNPWLLCGPSQGLN
jgi:DNA replication protein DnaC